MKSVIPALIASDIVIIRKEKIGDFLVNQNNYTIMKAVGVMVSNGNMKSRILISQKSRIAGMFVQVQTKKKSLPFLKIRNIEW